MAYDDRFVSFLMIFLSYPWSEMVWEGACFWLSLMSEWEIPTK